ncbi:retroviral-like aspartic protease family protein [Nostocaceae cyanobacterium CENA357]|uniref:Retroviral-like aspartic protease family protein n=1 Tax=Atlanticothrix silvestris CENA357 TaxID=1725252 RepID=A0A8J7HJF3_9CYAN|nr:retropepsin-like aspartic protease [Atlanticothrix silvestris]MBH8555913.1 retroviral-like aspartic protease family protein [Atlanticothrix silvestris CENA357]
MKNAWKRWIKISNLAVITAIPTLISLADLHRATAEDPGACFMINSAGRTVRLTQLCSRTKTPLDSVSSDKRIFRVPIKRRLGGTPIIDVTFNDKQTFEMIVDTGASGTLITLGMASTLKLEPTGMMKAQIADGSQVQFSTSKVNSIAVGGVVANNIEVAIAPKAGIGLLGHDFFGNYNLTVLEQEVEFHPR